MTESLKTIHKMVSSKDVSDIIKTFSGKKILIASRYKKHKGAVCIYGVLGFYVGRIIESCGGNVDYVILGKNAKNDFKRSKARYDYGIACYYDTDICVNSHKKFFKHFISICNKTMYYTNLVPCNLGFDVYGLSREAYLDRRHNTYNRSCYSLPRNFKKAVFIGRGCDPYLMKPEQSSKFTVFMDAARNPYTGRVAAEMQPMYQFLKNAGMNVILFGLNPNKKYKQVTKKPYFHMPRLYNRSHVYISSIKGLYELPILEAQTAGAYVISYKNRLHRDLYNPESSFITSEVKQTYQILKIIQKNYDANIPRQWVIDNGFVWTDVVGRIARAIQQ